MEEEGVGGGGGRRYVEWEEVVVSHDKGRRVVHYYLRDAAGAAELAVVGKERSLRHMSYAVPSRFARAFASAGAAGSPSLSPAPSASSAEGLSLKWRSRREVVDWLSSLVSGLWGTQICDSFGTVLVSLEPISSSLLVFWK